MGQIPTPGNVFHDEDCPARFYTTRLERDEENVLNNTMRVVMEINECVCESLSVEP